MPRASHPDKNRRSALQSRLSLTGANVDHQTGAELERELRGDVTRAIEKAVHGRAGG